jgi:hypothetical protein
MNLRSMPKQILTVIPWLALTGLVDWLITRTLTRAAIHMPKTPEFISVYQVLVTVGQVASNLVSLLAVLILAWLAWYSLRRRQDRAVVLNRPVVLNRILGLTCLALIPASLLALVRASAGWLDMIFQVLFSAALVLLVWKAWCQSMQPVYRIAVILTGLALLSARLFQGLPAFFSAFHLPGPSSLSGFLFNAGELLVVLSALAFWLWSRAAFGRAPFTVWLVAGLPALAFTALHLSSPAMTGILAIWSVGLSLYLPWPLYTVSIWLVGVAMIQALRSGSPAGWAILLLVVSGYAAQINTLAFLGLIAVWLLLIIGRQDETEERFAQTENKPITDMFLETERQFILESIAGRRTN